MPKIALSKLKPFEKNPRKIDKKELEKLQKRLEKYPDLFEGRPILVNKDYEIFAGNQRYHAAKELGLKEVPVKVIDCSPEDAFRMGTIDNAHSGEWLTEELIELAKEFDTDLTEFNLGADVEKIIQKLNEPEIKEDEAPPVPKKARAKLGDLYALGEHRLLCGDATSLKDVERLMGGEKADMVDKVLTDVVK